jgi:hypothetical protein
MHFGQVWKIKIKESAKGNELSCKERKGNAAREDKQSSQESEAGRAISF